MSGRFFGRSSRRESRISCSRRCSFRGGARRGWPSPRSPPNSSCSECSARCTCGGPHDGRHPLRHVQRRRIPWRLSERVSQSQTHADWRLWVRDDGSTRRDGRTRASVGGARTRAFASPASPAPSERLGAARSFAWLLERLAERRDVRDVRRPGRRLASLTRSSERSRRCVRPKPSGERLRRPRAHRPHGHRRIAARAASIVLDLLAHSSRASDASADDRAQHDDGLDDHDEPRAHATWSGLRRPRWRCTTGGARASPRRSVAWLRSMSRRCSTGNTARTPSARGTSA